MTFWKCCIMSCASTPYTYSKGIHNCTKHTQTHTYRHTYTNKKWHIVILMEWQWVCYALQDIVHVCVYMYVRVWVIVHRSSGAESWHSLCYSLCYILHNVILSPKSAIVISPLFRKMSANQKTLNRILESYLIVSVNWSNSGHVGCPVLFIWGGGGGAPCIAIETDLLNQIWWSCKILYILPGL